MSTRILGIDCDGESTVFVQVNWRGMRRHFSSRGSQQAAAWIDTTLREMGAWTYGNDSPLEVTINIRIPTRTVIKVPL